MTRPQRFAAALVVGLWASGAAAEPEQDNAQAQGSDTPPSDEAFRPEIAPLPKPPEIKLPAAKPQHQEILDQLLQRLRDSEPQRRRTALEEVQNVDEALLPAILFRLNAEADSSDRRKMKQLLLDIRKVARDEVEKRMRAAGEKGEVATPDYLDMVVLHPESNAEAWPDLVNVLALSRMCVHIGSVEAVRVLIHVYVRFEFLRIDTQLQIGKLGDRALAALIETTRHQAPEVSNWANRQMDFLGKAIPGEAVQVEDPQVLADVLRAYGRIADPDAARVVLSFANSERAQIREAARQAVVLFGEVANWQLRDAYENMLGKRPPREWSWDRTARELFSEFDSMRLTEVYTHYKKGLTARGAGDLEAMRNAFEQVLLRTPDFQPREEMLAGYMNYAETYFDQPDKDVPEVLVRVMRLAGDNVTLKARAESLLLTLRARKYADQSFADQSLLQRAMELDPDNTKAKALLSELQREPVIERTSFMRVFWPALLFAATLGAVTAILLRRRKTTAG